MLPQLFRATGTESRIVQAESERVKRVLPEPGLKVTTEWVNETG